MAQVDDELKHLYQIIKTAGDLRNTRTGQVKSIWKHNMSFNLQEEFPAVTSKKLAWKATVGELLWFLSGSSSLADLKHKTFGDSYSDKWTIWTDDARRWGNGNFVGNLYPRQWRDQNDGRTFIGECGVDQIQNLIHRLKHEPYRRDHIVMAWNAYDIENDLMALKPCHIGFQCYVTNEGYLNLHWWQRSVDSYLGAPMNIASYALLTHLLAKWTGLKPGVLTCDLGDVHLYENHQKAVETFLINPKFKPCQLELPEGTESLESTLRLTADDFKDALVGYESMGVVKAPLSVGA
jgi:thymidylate synthase